MKRVDPSGCAVVNQDVSRPVIRREQFRLIPFNFTSKSTISTSIQLDQGMHVKKKNKWSKCLCLSPTCWVSVIQSTKQQTVWRWWLCPQAPGQPPHHLTPSSYVGSPYPPGRGERKIMNDRSGFLTCSLGCKTNQYVGINMYGRASLWSGLSHQAQNLPGNWRLNGIPVRLAAWHHINLLYTKFINTLRLLSHVFDSWQENAKKPGCSCKSVNTTTN